MTAGTHQDAHDRTTAPLTLGESVVLVHALVDHVARGAGARVLFIKGPVLTAQGLRGDDHLSVDVDVLVAPDEVARLRRALEDAGWRHLDYSVPASAVPRHAETYQHPRWACTVDVHASFPGFLGDPQDVFEALWQRRSGLELAGRVLPVSDRVGSAAVAALHYLRNAADPYRQGQLDELVGLVRASFGSLELSALSWLAGATGAADTLAPFLTRVGAPLPVSTPCTGDAWNLWQLRSQTRDLTTVNWLVAVRRSPLHRRPAVLWRALVLSEAEIRRAQPSLAPGRLPVARARIARLRRGLRALPHAASALRRAEVA